MSLPFRTWARGAWAPRAILPSEVGSRARGSPGCGPLSCPGLRGPGRVGPTCVLRGADAVAVALLVHRPHGPGRRQPPVRGERVCRNRGVRSVEGPLASVAVPCCGPGLCIPPGGGICQEPRRKSVLVPGGAWSAEVKALRAVLLTSSTKPVLQGGRLQEAFPDYYCLEDALPSSHGLRQSWDPEPPRKPRKGKDLRTGLVSQEPGPHMLLALNEPHH